MHACPTSRRRRRTVIFAAPVMRQVDAMELASITELMIWARLEDNLFMQTCVLEGSRKQV